MLKRFKKCSTNTKKFKLIVEKWGALSRDKIEVRDFFQLINFFFKTPDHLPTCYERDSRDCCYQGGTIYNDAASSFIWVGNQFSVGSNGTAMSKSLLEKSLWNQASGEVSHYHVDNGIFTATEYRHGCNKKGHSKIFLVLVPSTRPRDLNVIFKLLCTWSVRVWCMLCCIGLREFLMVSICSI